MTSKNSNIVDNINKHRLNQSKINFCYACESCFYHVSFMLIKNNDKNAADDHIILYYVITHSGNHTKAQDFWLELVFKIKRDTHKKKMILSRGFFNPKMLKGEFSCHFYPDTSQTGY